MKGLKRHILNFMIIVLGGEIDVKDGLWKPNGKGLGMGFVFDWCNENIKNFNIRY